MSHGLHFKPEEALSSRGITSHRNDNYTIRATNRFLSMYINQQREYPISQKARLLIRETWAVAKKNGNIAPKAFIRYFKLRPDKQQLFPAFANVSLVDLPSNNHFLNQAFTCLSSLNVYINNLGKNPKHCPYLTTNTYKIDPQNFKVGHHRCKGYCINNDFSNA